LPSAWIERYHNFVVAFNAENYPEDMVLVKALLCHRRVAICFNAVRRNHCLYHLRFSHRKTVAREDFKFLSRMLSEAQP